VFPVFFIAFGSSVVYTLSQVPVYQSSSTYLVKPSPGLAQELFTALNMVVRQPEIAETYAQLGRSRTVRRQANDALGLTAGAQQSLEIESRVVPGTTIIELTVRSPDLMLAHDYAAALGNALTAYLVTVDEVFDLVQIDPPGVPSAPVRPNIPLNLLLGGAAALIAALGLGYVTEILAGVPAGRRKSDIVDRDSTAYNKAYFLRRLGEEISRTRRTGAPLAVAVVNLNHRNALDGATRRQRGDAMRSAAALLRTQVRNEDLVARLDDSTFGLLLVSTDERAAAQMIDGIRAQLSGAGLESNGLKALRVPPATGVSVYTGGALSDDELVDRAKQALQDADLAAVDA
jgi:diguanylate cyclase (GGDEF)-like protein